MNRLVAAACLVGGCSSVSAPPSFSAGESWTAPLIGPLEDTLLLVPVFVNGRGPYTFAIDTDANYSVVTKHVVVEGKLDMAPGEKIDDESGTQRDRFYAEVLGLEIGTLTVDRVSAEVLSDHGFDIDGRSIDGVIGRDVIADSIAFSFDRDHGMVTLMTQEGFKRSAVAFSAPPITYKVLSTPLVANTRPVVRRLVTAQIDGMPFTLHLDFGATNSQLRDRSWQKAALTSRQQAGSVVDEVGTPRAIDHIGEAASVTLADVTTPHVTFVPYADKRWHDQDVEGTLGLGFFNGKTVLVNADKSAVYTKPRGDLMATVADRIGRWQGSLMPKCPHVGCVTVTMTDPLAGKAPEARPTQHPGVVVSVVRDSIAANVAIEALVAVQTPDPAAHPQWLVVNMPAAVGRAMTHLSAAYVGAQLSVVDASPFPRACPDGGSCIDAIRPPGEAMTTTAPAPPAP